MHNNLQWLEEDFLGYLKEWEKSVKGRKGFNDAEKNMMMLSQETLEGLQITGICVIFVDYSIIWVLDIILLSVKSFVGLTKYLLKRPELKDKYVLSEKISQDPLENHFGRLRAHGGWCSNPTAH